MYIYTFPQTELSPFPAVPELSKMLVESGRRAVYRLPDVLYAREVTSLMHALATPAPLARGYWISTSWVSNAKKYLEVISLPTVVIRDGGPTAINPLHSGDVHGSGSKKANKRAKSKMQ